MLRRKLPPKRDRTGEFDSFVPRGGGTRAIMAAGLKDGLKGMGYHPITPPKVSRKQRTRQDLRDSANGENCLMVLPGCTGAAILSHNRHKHAGKGLGIKALDLASAYACPNCDAIYDGQAKRPLGWSADMVEFAWYRAHDQTLVKFVQKGLL